MEKQKKKWLKPLLIGAAAVCVLAVATVYLLFFTNLFGDKTAIPVEEETVVCDIYWNVDRDLYYGVDSSESQYRQRAEDGNYWVRFFRNGEITELMLADPSLASSIDANYLMGLVFDENGAVINTVNIDDLPVQKPAWKYYVSAVDGNTVQTNSSYRYDGMEYTLTITDSMGVYDMTGVSGPVGVATKLQEDDRIICLADADGNVTDVFVYGRQGVNSRIERYCEHCKEEVIWSNWFTENALPVVTGHYFLTTDVTMHSYANIKLEQKVCLDLNGHTVTGAENKRIYSTFYGLTELAIMDYSDRQNGKLVAWGNEGVSQGGCVWVRYGKFSLYAGTLDGSGYVSGVHGTTVNVSGGARFDMYGGTIIGGKAVASVSDSTKTVKYGMGGAIAVSGIMNMYDGTIRDGYAKSYFYKHTNKWHVGYGGNVVVSGANAVFDMYGGQILNGQAEGGGGNVFVVSKATFNFHDGLIDGGITRRKNTQGGNLTVAVDSTCNMYGGTICGGIAPLYGGNVRVDGTMNMVGGSIFGGEIIDQNTGAFKESNTGKNVYFSKGSFVMYGGWIDGSFLANDAAKDGVQPELILTGQARIFGAGEGKTNLKIGTSNDGCSVTVAQFYGSAKIHVTASGFFTLPTDAANAAYFTCDDPTLSVVHVNERLFVGRMGCLCGYEKHIGECDGELLTWGAWTTEGALPTNDGYYYLTEDVQCGANNIAENANVVLDLNGKTVTVTAGKRAYSTFNKNSSLTIVDSSADKSGKIVVSGTMSAQGNGVWVRYGSFTLYGGTIDAANATNTYKTGGCAVHAGNGTSVIMYGGTVLGGTASVGSALTTNATTKGEFHGGIIDGHIFANNSITVSGNLQAQITITASKLVNIGELTEGAVIFLDGSSTTAVAQGEELEAKLQYLSCKEGLTLRVDGTELYIDMPSTGHVACKVCAGAYDDCKHTETVEYTPVGDDLSVINAGGHYYLTQDITLSTQVAITEGKTVVLDLNGHSIECPGRVIAMNKAATLTITDSAGGGRIAAKTAKKDNGMVINVNNANAVMTLYAGTIDGTGVTNGNNGAAMNVAGTFKMYGGTIIGGKGVDGGTIRVNNAAAIFEMYDGEIYGGTASGLGHNLYIKANKYVLLAGGKIAGGVYYGTGVLKVEGDIVIDKALTAQYGAELPVPSYSYKQASGMVMDAAGGLSGDARICVSLVGTEVLIKNLADEMQAASFFMDDAEAIRTYDADAKTLTVTAA